MLMAGGSGTRLWPLSRAAHPKQFLSLYNEETMLQSTVKRLDGLDINSTIIMCNEKHRFFVAEQLREIDRLGTIILEPEGRNTAPAITLAALAVNDDPLLLILTADHVIRNDDAFIEAVTAAIPLAEAGKLVTFGIIPNKPDTGYGYIKKGDEIGGGFKVEEFIEKPGLDLARKFICSDRYYWNSGMFLVRASRYLEELKKFSPDIYEACELSMENIQKDLDFLRVNSKRFEACPSESIDIAVMEKTEDAVVVPMDAV